MAVSQTGCRSASFNINLRMPPDPAMHIPVLNPSSSDLTLKYSFLQSTHTVYGFVDALIAGCEPLTSESERLCLFEQINKLQKILHLTSTLQLTAAEITCIKAVCLFKHGKCPTLQCSVKRALWGKTTHLMCR